MLYCIVSDDLQCTTAGRAVDEGQAMTFDCMVEYNVDLNDQHHPVLAWFSDTASSLSNYTEIVGPTYSHSGRSFSAV